MADFGVVAADLSRDVLDQGEELIALRADVEKLRAEVESGVVFTSGQARRIDRLVDLHADQTVQRRELEERVEALESRADNMAAWAGSNGRKLVALEQGLRDHDARLSRMAERVFNVEARRPADAVEPREQEIPIPVPVAGAVATLRSCGRYHAAKELEAWYREQVAHAAGI